MKSWISSKTIWFNAITGVVVVATFFGYTPNAAIAEAVSAILLSFTPLINIALRFVTKTGIKV